MSGYFICFAIALLLGFYLGNRTGLYKKNNKPTTENISAVAEKPINDPRIRDIKRMLNEVKVKRGLTISINKSVMNALIEIANTPNWEKQIDNETIKNLHNIYIKWYNSQNQSNKVIGVAQAEGFNNKKYWKGTIEDYNKAVANNEIDENTEVNIIEYTGSIIAMDSDGQIDEYMD